MYTTHGMHGCSRVVYQFEVFNSTKSEQNKEMRMNNQ
jgi:hypothetical protein